MVRLGDGDAHQVIAGALASRLDQQGVLAFDHLLHLLAMRPGLLLVIPQRLAILRTICERRLQRAIAIGEDTIERIVIGGRHRVVLMIVAARTRHRQSEKAASGGVHAVIRKVSENRIEKDSHPEGKIERPE